MAEHTEYQGSFSGSQIDSLLAKIQTSQVYTSEEKTRLASLVNYDDTEVKEDITGIEASLDSHKTDTSNPHQVTKAQVGLGNVDNTADIDKPVSTAVSAALIDKVDKVSGKGLSTNDYTNTDKANLETALTKANAAAPQSTTYTKTEVDTALSAKQDTISDLATIRSGATLGATAVQPVSGKGLSTNDFTDAEKTKLDDHVVDTNNPHQVTKEQVGLGNVDNTSDADKPISAAVQAPLARLIDAGAKNLLNLVAPTTTNRMTITDAGNGSVTASCSNVTWANSGYELSLTAGKSYNFLIYVDSANVADVQFQCFLHDVSGDTTQELGRTSRITSPGVYSVNFVATTKIRVGININNSSRAATGSATYHAMLCTAEDYAISHEVVPYRPSYDELVARIEALERAGE